MTLKLQLTEEQLDTAFAELQEHGLDQRIINELETTGVLFIRDLANRTEPLTFQWGEGRPPRTMTNSRLTAITDAIRAYIEQ